LGKFVNTPAEMEKPMNKKRITTLNDLERRLSYRFQNIELLDNALVHSSFVNENPDFTLQDNERLEFLGDAVLELCVSTLLMQKYPEFTEGQLSKLRAAVVNEPPLSELARMFHLGDFILLGKGEENSGGRMKNSILANSFEAVMAAIYLDCGFDYTCEYIKNLFEPLIDKEGTKSLISRDFKTLLQEICQNRFKIIPQYTIVDEQGPDHDKRFEVRLIVGDGITAAATGKSKKEAEQRAAQKAMEIMKSGG
jgi:ribonuclease III